jgi:hypothetical protein
MKILLDETLPHAMRHELSDHEVFTVQYLKWSGTKNGALLAKAEKAGFEAMITMDDGVEYQQNLKDISIAVVILVASSNDIDDLLPLLPALRRVLRKPRPGRVVRIG